MGARTGTKTESICTGTFRRTSRRVRESRVHEHGVSTGGEREPQQRRPQMPRLPWFLQTRCLELGPEPRHLPAPGHVVRPLHSPSAGLPFAEGAPRKAKHRLATGPSASAPGAWATRPHRHLHANVHHSRGHSTAARGVPRTEQKGTPEMLRKTRRQTNSPAVRSLAQSGPQGQGAGGGEGGTAKELGVSRGAVRWSGTGHRCWLHNIVM